jgi:hypothetical protein
MTKKARDAMTQKELDLWVLEQTERETEAQLAIIRALKPLAGRADRERVIGAVQHIVAADGMVPGIFEMVSERASRFLWAEAASPKGKKGARGKKPQVSFRRIQSK